MLKELLSKKWKGPAAKREAVAHLQAVMGLSERRACSFVGADRKMIRYRSCRPPETELRGKLRDLANDRRRFGYRRLFVLLRREGEPSGINRIYRLYREEGLTVRKRRARRRAVGTSAPILVAARPNARWSLDFVYDQFACGRRFRVLNIVDDVTRECLAAIPDTSISGRRVVGELTDLISRRGKPDMIVSDHGTEFTSNAARFRRHQFKMNPLRYRNTVDPSPGYAERISMLRRVFQQREIGVFSSCDRSRDVAQPALAGGISRNSGEVLVEI